MGISFNTASLLNGNGIDVNGIVSEIQSAQSGQLTEWQGDVTTLQTQASALTGINTDLSNLQSAVQGLTTGALTAVTAASSESAIVGATAQAHGGSHHAGVNRDALHGLGSQRDDLNSAHWPNQWGPQPPNRRSERHGGRYSDYSRQRRHPHHSRQVHQFAECLQQVGDHRHRGNRRERRAPRNY